MKTIPILTQNVDTAISARDYADLGNKILITSIFDTIQGEGPLAGYPAIFVRLAGCNFGDKKNACDFCDTSFFFDKGTAYDPRDLLKSILALPSYNSSRILVITGGEPTLQLNLLAFMVYARPHFADIQIETNGTQPKFFDEASARDMLYMSRYFKTVVSPKANNKTNKYAKIPQAVLQVASCLKYVLTADPNSPHHTVPEEVLNLGKKIYVSPMAVYLKPYSGEVSSIWEDGLIDKEATAANYNYAAIYAMKHNLLLSVQTHLFIGLA